MAESNENTWWGSWYNSAKSKSAEVFEAVRKDLGEVTNAVKAEASAAGTVLQSTFKLDEPDSTASQVKKSFSAFLGQMNTVLNPEPDDEDAEAIIITADHEAVSLTGLQKYLLELQMEDSTYLSPPEPDLHKQYNRWLEVLDDQLSHERLAKHLASSEILNKKYDTLVPDKVEHQDFWMRYLFRKALLEDGLAQAEAAERKAKLLESSTATTISPTEVVEPTTVQPSPAGESPKKSIASKADSEAVQLVSSVSNDSFSQSLSLTESAKTSPSRSSADQSQINEEALAWELEDFNCDVELSEEEQLKLLQEYEQEIASRASNVKSKNGASKSDLKIQISNKNDKKVALTKKSVSNENIKKQVQQPVKQTKMISTNKKNQEKSAKVIKTMEKTQPINKTKVNEDKKEDGDKIVDEALSIDSNHFMLQKSSTKLLDSENKASDNRSNNSDESWEKIEDLED